MEAGQSAFLLEESDETADVFQCRIGNLPPDTEATIRSVFRWILNGSVRGRVSSSSMSFWTPSNLHLEWRTPPT